jgi:uncharacterized membrane protein
MTRLTGTLHGNYYTLMTISRSFLLRMKNLRDEICRENQNTDFMFNNVFLKFVPFMISGEIW